MKEEWKYVADTNEKYQVSNFGQVRSLYNSVGKLREEPLYLKPWQTGGSKS